MCAFVTTRLEKRLSQQRQARNMKVKRGLVILTALLLLLMSAAAAYLWFGGGLKAKRTGGLPFSEKKINILVLGVDQRSDDVGRSDTMFVVTIDTDSKQVSLLSVPRDTRVKIPGFGWDKINHAYAEGGHKLSIKAVEGLLGIPIDYYVLINFSGFYKIVDAIGGVTIDVEKRMYYSDPYDNLVIDLRPGVQHMNGKTAIQYVRYRDEDGDIGRIARQQKFIKAMFKEVVSPMVLPRIPAIIQEINSAVKTDLSQPEMLNLAKILNDAYKQGLKTDTVPGRPGYIADISYWLPDVVALREDVMQTQGVTMDAKMLAEAESLESEYKRSIPREMKVAEVPKILQDVKKQANKDKANTAKTAPAAAAKPGQADDKIKVVVLNSSGVADAGEKIAGIMRSQGFEVESVVNSGSPNKNTVVISHTTNNAVVGKLTGLPFKYVLQVTKDDSKSNQVTVVVGKDYTGK